MTVKVWKSEEAREASPYKETFSEKQSGVGRVKWAEGLISQLPSYHDGRNSWLLNYGVGGEAIGLQSERNLVWDNETKSAKGTTKDKTMITDKKLEQVTDRILFNKDREEAESMDAAKTAETHTPASYYVGQLSMEVYFRGSCILTIPASNYAGLIANLAAKLPSVAPEMPWQQQKVIDMLGELVECVEEQKDVDTIHLLDELEQLIKTAESE